MVSRSSLPVLRRTSPSEDRPSRFSAAAVGYPAREPKRFASAHVAVIGRSLRRLGASSAALERLRVAQRASAKSMYASHWWLWVQWCAHDSVDSLAPSGVRLASSIAFLSLFLHLSPLALKARRAAVRAILRLMGSLLRLSSRTSVKVLPCELPALWLGPVTGFGFSSRASGSAEFLAWNQVPVTVLFVGLLLDILASDEPGLASPGRVLKVYNAQGSAHRAGPSWRAFLPRNSVGLGVSKAEARSLDDDPRQRAYQRGCEKEGGGGREASSSVS